MAWILLKWFWHGSETSVVLVCKKYSTPHLPRRQSKTLYAILLRSKNGKREFSFASSKIRVRISSFAFQKLCHLRRWRVDEAMSIAKSVSARPLDWIA